jgi:hypothetical protein
MPPEQTRGVLEGAPVAAHGVDRSLEQQLAHDGSRFLQVSGKCRVDFGVLLRETGELADGLVHIFGKDDVVAIVQGAEEIGRRKDHEAMLAQLEIAHHLGMQEAHDVGEHRKGEAGDHFLRHHGPAQDVAALEHKRPQPGLR